MSIGYQVEETVEHASLIAHQQEGSKGAMPSRKLDTKRKKIKLIFSKVFHQDEWELNESKTNLFIYTHKNKLGNIHIELSKNASVVSFWGHPIEKIIDAANAYKEVERGVFFEVEAGNLEDAKKFMLELQQNGFDISQIKEISLKDKEKVDDALVAKLINEIKAQWIPPKQKSKSKPKPSGVVDPKSNR